MAHDGRLAALGVIGVMALLEWKGEVLRERFYGWLCGHSGYCRDVAECLSGILGRQTIANELFVTALAYAAFGVVVWLSLAAKR